MNGNRMFPELHVEKEQSDKGGILGMSLAMDRVLSLVVLLSVGALALWQMRRWKNSDEELTVRKISALEAIPELIGRAVEMGRPIHFTSGVGKIDNEFAPQTLASVEILGHIARVSAQYDANLIVSVAPPLVYPLQREAVRAGYVAAGKAEKFSEDRVRFLSDNQMAYASAAVGIVQREKAAANIMIGAFYAEALLIAEAALHSGAVQIGGTARMQQVPFLAVVSDYLLIGEEMFVGGAYLSRDRAKLGAIRGQDISKLIVLASLAIGGLLGLLHNDAMVQILKKYGN